MSTTPRIDKNKGYASITKYLKTVKKPKDVEQITAATGLLRLTCAARLCELARCGAVELTAIHVLSTGHSAGAYTLTH